MTVKQLTVCISDTRDSERGYARLVDRLRSDPSIPYEHHRIKHYDYGTSYPHQYLRKANRKRLADAIGGYLHKCTSKYNSITHLNVLANSFGTWGLCYYLLNCEHDELDLDTIILTNSVVKSGFPWTDVIHRDELVDSVLNVQASYDAVPFLLGAMTPLGWSGHYYGGFSSFKDDAAGNVRTHGIQGYHGWYTTEEGVEFLRSIIYDLGGWVGTYQEQTA